MPLHRLPEALLAAALLLSSHALQAEPRAAADSVSACPDGREGVVGDDLPAYEALLAARAVACTHDAAFLAWHGAVLNRLGRFQAAPTASNALLIDPRLMGRASITPMPWRQPTARSRPPIAARGVKSADILLLWPGHRPQSGPLDRRATASGTERAP
jgi:hypothetical protein